VPRRLANWRADIVGVEITFMQKTFDLQNFLLLRLNISVVESITNPRNFIA